MIMKKNTSHLMKKNVSTDRVPLISGWYANDLMISAPCAILSAKFELHCKGKPLKNRWLMAKECLMAHTSQVAIQ